MPNIVTDYTWTATTGSYKDECPRIFAKTFEPLNSDIYNNLANWAESIKPNRQYKTYYNDLHTTDPKDRWVFPYFDDTARSFTNEWGDQRVDSTSSKVTGLLAQYFETNVTDAVANLVASTQEVRAILQGNNNSMLLEPPKFYQYGNSDTDVVVEFPLINTINPSIDIPRNWKLINKLIKENRFERLGGAATKSPYLWSIIIPGYRAIRWASCNVDVTFVGNRKYIIGTEGNKIVPEGYRVKLTFKSLYTEPRNFMADVGGEFLG